MDVNRERGVYNEIYTAHGVGISGLEWTRDGKLFLPDEETYRYFSCKGFNLFRIAIKWEWIQPELNAPLNQEFAGHIRDNIKWAKSADSNSKIIIDIHNYAKYGGKSIDSEPEAVTTADFCDLWVRLSREFRNEPNIYGYGLMNEPAHISDEKWFEVSQAAVTAIRNDGDNKMISVAGPGWSGAHNWPTHRKPWINDPANNLMYEAHQYFDRDFSGCYSKVESYAVLNEYFDGDIHAYFTGVMRRWIDWLNKYKLKGFIGEFATPYNEDGPEWNELLNTVMELLHKNGIDTAYWAAGPVWPSSFNAIIQPHGGVDAPQMEILEKYKSKAVRV